MVELNNEILIEQENIVEAILFMMGESVGLDTLAIALESNKDVAFEACERLVYKYQTEYTDRGMKVIRINDRYQMVSNNKYFKNLVLVASNPQKPVITEAVLETLSIIAYKQPITKPEIEDIRGVKSDFACNRLLEYGLIEEKGRLDTPGRPIQFGTTEEFMLRFGLTTLDDLPNLSPIREEEIKNEVEKELTKTLGEPVFINDNDKNEDIKDTKKIPDDDINKDSIDDSTGKDDTDNNVLNDDKTNDTKEPINRNISIEDDKENNNFNSYINEDYKEDDINNNKTNNSKDEYTQINYNSKEITIDDDNNNDDFENPNIQMSSSNIEIEGEGAQ